ncbi:hypothetical protein BC827DRAFT_1201512, partial [Russula dissimulans]
MLRSSYRTGGRGHKPVPGRGARNAREKCPTAFRPSSGSESRSACCGLGGMPLAASATTGSARDG